MSKIQVLIDGVAFENSCQLGIWRVFYEVMRRTSQDIQYTLLLNHKPQQPIPDGVETVACWHRRWPERKGFADRAWRKSSKVLLRRRFQNAIFHSTFFTIDPRIEGCNIVTVFDMIAEKYFYLENALYGQQQLKFESISRASGILSISHATMKDLEVFFPEIRCPMNVMPLGAEHLIDDSSGAAISGPRNALFVGNRNSYKNFLVVLEALASKNWPKNLMLTVVGAPFTEAETKLLHYYSVAEKILHVGRVTDRRLAEIYRQSLCFIFSSLAEGFGIPVLEAQANNCVALLSDISIFREVAGEGAIFFNPFDPNDLCNAIGLALEPANRQRVCGAARANLHRFSWDSSASKVLEAYLQGAASQPVY